MSIVSAKHDVSLSVFFPCFNEQENVSRVVRRAIEVLCGLVADWEVIVVNDGSSDRTGELADALAAEDERVRAVHHERNSGYGAALRSGFAAATKQYVFYTDGDGQFDIAELDLLLSRREEATIISGYRRRRRDSAIRRLNAGAGDGSSSGFWAFAAATWIARSSSTRARSSNGWNSSRQGRSSTRRSSAARPGWVARSSTYR